MSIVTGAVNGVATTANVATAGVSPVTIPYFPGGTNSTLAVDTDGSGLHSPNHRVAVICGNTSGRDHFPFRVKDAVASIPNAAYQNDVDLAVLMKWFWLVKTWQLTGTITWHTIDPATEEEVNYTATFNSGDDDNLGHAFTSVTDITSESQLDIYDQITNLGGSIDVTNDTDGTVGSFDTFGWRLMGSGGEGAIIWGPPGPSSSNLYFQFGFGFLPTGTIRDEDGIEVSTDDGSGTNPACVGHLEIDGNEILLYMSSHGPNVNSDGSGVRIDLVLDPVEFWPYATTTGSAVYDTSTGAQINDPLS